MRSDAKPLEQKEQTTEIELGDGYRIQCPYDIVCSISQAEVAAIPLRLVDEKKQEEKQVYDAKNILTHLQHNPISPFTRKAVSYLLYDDKLEQKRCDFFQTQLKKVNYLKSIEQEIKTITTKFADAESKSDRGLRNQRNALKKKKNKIGDIPKSARDQIERLSRLTSQQEKDAINQRAQQLDIKIEGPGFEDHPVFHDEASNWQAISYYTALSYSASNILFSAMFASPFNRPPSATISLGAGPISAAAYLNDADLAIVSQSFFCSAYTTVLISMAVDVGSRIAVGVFGIPPEHAQVLAPIGVTAALIYGDRALNRLYSVGQNIYSLFSRSNNRADVEPRVIGEPIARRHHH